MARDQREAIVIRLKLFGRKHLAKAIADGGLTDAAKVEPL
jgi:hypothetical protein